MCDIKLHWELFDLAYSYSPGTYTPSLVFTVNCRRKHTILFLEQVCILRKDLYVKKEMQKKKRMERSNQRKKVWKRSKVMES